MNRTGLLGGKTVLVTGATSGIGFYMASALARQGATVYITGRSEARGREAESQLCITADHERVHFVSADASTVRGNQEFAKHILAALDRASQEKTWEIATRLVENAPSVIRSSKADNTNSSESTLK